VGCIDGQISIFETRLEKQLDLHIVSNVTNRLKSGLKSSGNRAEEAMKNAKEADQFG